MDTNKTIAEIQRAHDELCAVVASGALELCPPLIAGQIKAQLSVTCWMLGHPAGRLFANNLTAIAAVMKARQDTPGSKEVVH